MHLCEYKKQPMDINTLTNEITRLHADLCSAVADPRRILMLYALANKPLNVGELTAILNISQPSTSRHLKILRERGLVKAERDGTTIVYSLVDERLINALDLLRAVLRDRIEFSASLLGKDGQSPAL